MNVAKHKRAFVKDVKAKWQDFHFVTTKDLHSRKWWMSWLWISLGCLLLSLGFELFMYPYKITPGGVWGMSVVLHELFPMIQQGWFGYMMDVPLLLSAFLVFGPVFGVKTVFAALLTPVWMLVLPYVLYPDVAEQTAQTLLWGHLDLSNNLILAVIFGAMLIGGGVGLVVRQSATTGGTDIVAMFLKKYAHTSFSTGIFIADSFVVICGIIVLCGFGGADTVIPLYSMVTIYLSVKVLDYVVEGGSDSKLMFIISASHQNEIKNFILNELSRGGTFIRSSGMYTRADRDMIFLVVSKREVLKVKKSLKAIDPASFVVVVDANETLGEGFKPFEIDSVMD